jgi:hypothetical protein
MVISFARRARAVPCLLVGSGARTTPDEWKWDYFPGTPKSRYGFHLEANEFAGAIAAWGALCQSEKKEFKSCPVRECLLESARLWFV